MPSKSYALEQGGIERVNVTWEGAFKDLALSFDGDPLGSFATAEELETPSTFPLPDGSRLEVSIAKFGPFPELRLARDGEPLPGSSGDPQTRLEGAANALFAVGALSALLGLVTALFDIGMLKAMGMGMASVIGGAVYAGLAVMVKKRSTMALAVAVMVFILDAVLMVVASAEMKASPPIGGMIARVFFLLPMLRGFGAIKELEKPRPRRARAMSPGQGARRAVPGRPSPTPPAPTRTPSRVGSVPAERTAAPAVNATPEVAPPRPAQVAKTLSGEAEKLRLKLSERNSAAAPVSAVGRRLDVKVATGVDAAKKSIRFIAHRCDIGEAGLRVTLASGDMREVAYGEIIGIVARQLPPDPPWDGALILDIVPSKELTGEPVRIFGTTVVNYAAIPGGGTTSRLDNTRRLIAFLRDRSPAAVLDEATQEFVRGPKVPQRFANMTQFIEYDATYG
ncbi:MAG: hypothetical protein KBH14_18115 [Vicinamibacteria bacterium]|nr:hypothetical protein [Vicinamibacteria bacterium]